MENKQIEEAQALFTDNMSLKIFNHRLNYTKTKESIHLLSMAEDAMLSYPYINYNGNLSLVRFAKDIITKGNKVKVIIWGTGNCSKVVSQLLYEYLIFTKPIETDISFCDNNYELWGTTMSHHNALRRLLINSPDELRDCAGKPDCYVVIAVNSSHANRAIYEQLISMGFEDWQMVHNIVPLNYYTGRTYFEPGIITPSEDEVFVDGGAYHLENTFDFINWCDGNYNRVLAFEADPVSYQKCRKPLTNLKLERVELFDKALFSSNTQVSFCSAPGGEYGGSRINNAGESLIEAVTLDSILDGKPATLIKMDIEGAEMEALKGALETIKKWKPRMAISVYHKPWDIIMFPLYLKSLNPDYSFYLRHHCCGVWDTVLYAV